jgi:hypothetical protein
MVILSSEPSYHISVMIPILVLFTVTHVQLDVEVRVVFDGNGLTGGVLTVDG